MSVIDQELIERIVANELPNADGFGDKTFDYEVPTASHLVTDGMETPVSRAFTLRFKSVKSPDDRWVWEYVGPV